MPRLACAMRITLTGIPVRDQARALAIYTEKLGFEVATDIPIGEHRWLTVTAPDGVEGVELLLEPLAFEPARTYYDSLYDAGIPAAQFESDDLEAEVARLRARGVVVRGAPVDSGTVRTVVFEDGCGNLISLVQILGEPPRPAA